MKETDDSVLKAEIDEIGKNIDDIMKRVESAVPSAPPPEENSPDTSDRDTPPETP